MSSTTDGMDITGPNFITKNTEGVYPPQIPQISADSDYQSGKKEIRKSRNRGGGLKLVRLPL
jgi:hypothetical protein